jgi:hypothetical protein
MARDEPGAQGVTGNLQNSAGNYFWSSYWIFSCRNKTNGQTVKPGYTRDLYEDLLKRKEP